METQDELERQGWKEASVSGGPHLTRVLEMYEEMGFETHLEPVDLNQCGACTECFKSGGETIYRVFVRAKD